MQKVKPEKQQRCHTHIHISLMFFFSLFIQISGDYGIMGCQVFKGSTKLDRFLPKNKRVQRKLLNFENWVSFQK